MLDRVVEPILCTKADGSVDKSDVTHNAADSWGLNNMNVFLEQGLDGIRQFVEAYESRLSDLVLDLVPYLSQFHSEFDPEKHSIIPEKLVSTCSNKELVLVACEQLSHTQCPNLYPLILPLFDLSLPFNADWLAGPLLNSLTEGGVCSECSTLHSNTYVIDCLSSLNPAHCTDQVLDTLVQIALHLIDTDRELLLSSSSSSPRVRRILATLDLSLSSVLCRGVVAGGGEGCWDPRCLIITTSIPSHLPLVYNMSWLFGRVVPWLLPLLEDIDVESRDVRPVLDTLVFFTTQHIIGETNPLQFGAVKRITDFLIVVAVNSQDSVHRQNASKCIRAIAVTLSIDRRIQLIAEYSDHENSSVAGMFIDLLRPILSQPKLPKMRIQKLKQLVSSLLNFDNFDVLEISDRILATLSTIQHCCRLPDIRNSITAPLETTMNEFLNHVDYQIGRRSKDITTDMGKLGESSLASAVPASIIVQGEVISEPSVDEQRQSYEMAVARLDLISFNTATTRRVLEGGSF